MARYAIGDIQGCYHEFIKLIAKINFNPSCDILYLVGDLVNRGPQSLEVMRWIYKHQDSLINVLGNHDFYLMARYNNLLKTSSDTLEDLIHDKNITKYIDYLRTNWLIFQDNEHILVHAGIYPKMNFNDLLQMNYFISQQLQKKDYAKFIAEIYGNKPSAWDKSYGQLKKMKFVINSCTRMRYLDNSDFSLDYQYTGEMVDAPKNLIPWFKVQPESSYNKKIICGHWSSLGLFNNEKLIALDTGCVWGKKLTAINLETLEIIQVVHGED